MSFAATLILLALIAVVGGIIMSRSEKTPARRANEADRAALKQEVSELKARIATLERIATDRPARLSREIDELADTGAVNANDATNENTDEYRNPDGTGSNQGKRTGTADTDRKD